MYNSYISSAYGSSSYNNVNNYNGSSVTTTTTGTTDPISPSPVLTNTGLDIAVAITLACLIIFVALLVRFWRRKSLQSVMVEVDNSTSVSRRS